MVKQTMWRARIAAMMLLAMAGAGVAGDDADAIRGVVQGTWDRPEAKVRVDPITVTRDYAIAGWTQGDMGGRALLRRTKGRWVVLLCGGDALLEARALRATGADADTASALAAATAQAESSAEKSRVAQFSRFEGLVTMNQTNPENTKGEK